MEDLRKRVNTSGTEGNSCRNSRVQPKTDRRAAEEKGDSACEKAQKLMLTWLVTYPGIFDNSGTDIFSQRTL